MPSAKNDKRMTLEQYATKYKTAFIEYVRDTKSSHVKSCRIAQNYDPIHMSTAKSPPKHTKVTTMRPVSKQK
jgi:hypothetical protein